MSQHEWKVEEDCASGTEALGFLGPASHFCLLWKNLFNACKNGSSSLSDSVCWDSDGFWGLPMVMWNCVQGVGSGSRSHCLKFTGQESVPER